jgi:hypothetical protein
MKLKFGKYKGKTIDWIKENDINYYEWASKNIPNFGTVKEKKIKTVVLNTLPPVLEMNIGFDFKFDSSWPDDTGERLITWFLTRPVKPIPKLL